MSHYDYTVLSYGVRLESPKIDREFRDHSPSVLLQGDDAASFLDEMEDLDAAWIDGNPNPKIFDCQEDHIDLIIGEYFQGGDQ